MGNYGKAYDSIIRRMRFACCITKATNTLGIHDTYCFSTATVATPTRIVTLHVHYLLCCDSVTVHCVLCCVSVTVHCVLCCVVL